MIYLNCIFFSLLSFGSLSLFNFEPNSDLSNWNIVDDVVMGGRSSGSLTINEEGNGVFHGFVSTANYGGFSSIRYNCEPIDVKNYTKAIIHLKGDGKPYQFRVKSDRYDRFSYVYEFNTSGEWENIEIPLNRMEPRFRGRQLNLANYPGEQIAELAFLIGNKKNETFQLEIDYIELR